ncbi:ABC transporter substrate-binding protein [Amnibacterium sp. CER49]|uniref:ABC transporter substrate-binding protein n=1 Tax=Amnibacterium sp. CER49 TaxID=3039161 RepID=UPI002448C721|nr:ABC transporter substrate-binding protein [Amnibacterium sp. CER49]MDH2442464.1 ABC transporter substrate-binding protein [Amnibacterium sp. CER49]
MTISRRGALGAATAVLAAAALSLTGCSSSNSLSGSGSSPKDTPAASSSGGSSTSAGGDSIVLGSANFPENEILMYIYGNELAKSGYTVSYKPSIGARAAYIAALKSGEINLVPEYAGSILSYLDKSANAKSGSAVKTALDAALQKESLKASAFSEAADSDSLNVTPAFAKQHSLSSIGDLKNAGSVTVAANPEFASRPDGIPGLKSVYGLSNIQFKAINDSGGNTTLKALLGGQVQVADIYSTTPSILQNKLVTLKDPKNLFASQQVVPVYSASKDSSKLTAALDKVSQALTTQDLLKLNEQVSGSTKTDPQTAAKDWLSSKGL